MYVPQMIASAVQENGLNQNMKLGLSYKSEKMVKIPTEEGQPFTYAVDDISAAPKVGNDIAEIINTNWQESECIMIEDPIHYTHIGALQLLKKVSFFTFFNKWTTKIINHIIFCCACFSENS